jgi:hypothetical protein
VKDFLGREYEVGDTVVYGAMSGRSVNMVYGEVTDFYYVKRNDNYRWERTDLLEGEGIELRVKIQPLNAARWEQHSKKEYWVDTRTGKRIDPTRSDKHVEVPAHYVYADGTTFDYEAKKADFESKEQWDRFYGSDYYHYFRRNYHVNHAPVGDLSRSWGTQGDAPMQQLWYVPVTYKDYVEERVEGPKPVTVSVTENIVKVERA